MKIEVTNCNDCAFCNDDNEYGTSCNFPGNIVEDKEMPNYSDTETLPTNCPLKFSGTVIIELSKKQSTVSEINLLSMKRK